MKMVMLVNKKIKKTWDLKGKLKLETELYFGTLHNYIVAINRD